MARLHVLNANLEAAENVAVAIDLGEGSDPTPLSAVVIVDCTFVLYSGIEGRRVLKKEYKEKSF